MSTPPPTLDYTQEYNQFIKDLKTAANFLPLNTWETDLSDPKEKNPWTRKLEDVGLYDNQADNGTSGQFRMTLFTKKRQVNFPDQFAEAEKIKKYLQDHGFNVSNIEQLGADRAQATASFGASAPDGGNFSYQMGNNVIMLDAYSPYFIPTPGSYEKAHPTTTQPFPNNTPNP